MVILNLKPKGLRCYKCTQIKAPEEFYGDISRPSGYSSACRECKKAAGKSPEAKQRKAQRYKEQLANDYIGTRRKKRDLHLKADYGISLLDFEKILDEQHGFCAICKQPPCGKQAKDSRGQKLPANLHVDHDHKTGQIRGLLCDKCNRGLGNFRDTPEFLEAAADYLRTFATQAPYKIIN